MDAKSIFASKTLWFNVVAAMVTAAWPIISPYLPLTGEQAAGIAALGNMILRYVTTQPVALAPK